eukprot:CAMPEP_0178452458 /NCGR_PEP_ID=MMETSP0689_2-20121128/44254_1 /TAXON_ID=160604 /ORGANISM="Amphidinium massartii, Strain CS-259" /LENGTH=96 /DNA_ID=CAMNT_0020078163 /DNA_START=9 /DNA_END=299 /DNA_ORIENTATION=+
MTIAALAWALLNDAYSGAVCSANNEPGAALAALLLAISIGMRVAPLKAEAVRVWKSMQRCCEEPELERFLGLGDASIVGVTSPASMCEEILTALVP